MARGHISFYKKDVSIIKIKKSDVQFSEDKTLPCLCTYADDKKIGIAFEYVKDEEAYLVDISTNKIFSCSLFKTDELPAHVGMPIYITQKGEMTGKKEGGVLVGSFLGLENGAVLFMLQ